MNNEDKTTDPLLEVLTRVRSMDSRLIALEQKTEERGRETRPMWEMILKELERINQRLETLETDVQSIKDQFYVLSSRDIQKEGELLHIRRRLEKLESNPNAPTERLP